VELVVSQSDLSALLASGTIDDVFKALHDRGFTALDLVGDAAVSDEAHTAATAQHVALQQHTVSPTEVKLLGLGSEPADPFDPFHHKQV
jgi:hypothetical protein